MATSLTKTKKIKKTEKVDKKALWDMFDTERDHTDTENKAEQDIEWTDRYDSVFFVDSATKHVKYICKSRNQQQTLSYIYIT